MFSRKLKLLLLSTAFALAAGTVAAKDILYANEFLQNGSYISSPNGRYSLVMQIDGSLVMYRSDGTIRYKMERYGTIAVMQDDGNFVQYKGTTPLWATYTFHVSVEILKNYLRITDSGDLRVEYGNAPYATVKWQIGDDPAPTGGGGTPGDGTPTTPPPTPAPTGMLALSPPGIAPNSFPPVGVNNATGSRY